MQQLDVDIPELLAESQVSSSVTDASVLALTSRQKLVYFELFTDNVSKTYWLVSWTYYLEI